MTKELRIGLMTAVDTRLEETAQFLSKAEEEVLADQVSE